MPLPPLGDKVMRYRLEFLKIIESDEVSIMLAMLGARAP